MPHALALGTKPTATAELSGADLRATYFGAVLHKNESVPNRYRTDVIVTVTWTYSRDGLLHRRESL